MLSQLLAAVLLALPFALARPSTPAPPRITPPPPPPLSLPVPFDAVAPLLLLDAASRDHSNLAPRQTTFTNETIPAGCRSTCAGTLVIYQACTTGNTAGCLVVCSQNSFNDFTDCFQCILDGKSGTTASDVSSVQNSVDDLKSACAAAGSPVTGGTLTYSPSSATGGALTRSSTDTWHTIYNTRVASASNRGASSSATATHATEDHSVPADAGVSRGARIGIGVGVSVGFFIVLLLVLYYVLRRREARRRVAALQGEVDGPDVEPKIVPYGGGPGRGTGAGAGAAPTSTGYVEEAYKPYQHGEAASITSTLPPYRPQGRAMAVVGGGAASTKYAQSTTSAGRARSSRSRGLPAEGPEIIRHSDAGSAMAAATRPRERIELPPTYEEVPRAG